MKIDGGSYSGELRTSIPFVSPSLRPSHSTLYQKLTTWMPTPSVRDDSSEQENVSEVPTVESESDKKERIRKEFEEGLDQRIRNQMPSIEILQVIETTVLPATASPVVKATASVSEDTASVPEDTASVPQSTASPLPPPSLSTTMPLPTTAVPQSATILPQPTTSLPQPTTKPQQPTTSLPHPTTRSPQPTAKPQPTTSLPHPTIRPQPSQTKPNPWKPNDPRFQDVTTRRFIGTQEVPYSLFDDRTPHSSS